MKADRLPDCAHHAGHDAEVRNRSHHDKSVEDFVIPEDGRQGVGSPRRSGFVRAGSADMSSPSPRRVTRVSRGGPPLALVRVPRDQDTSQLVGQRAVSVRSALETDVICRDDTHSDHPGRRPKRKLAPEHQRHAALLRVKDGNDVRDRAASGF